MTTLGPTIPLSRLCPHDPHPPQLAFLLAQELEVLYGGAAGGGKSDALLMAALQYVDVPGYSAILFRRTFTDLALPGAIMARAREWLEPWRQRGVCDWNEQRKVWTFSSGATLAFGYLQHPDDELRYQSAEFQFIGFDELTQFEEQPYRYMFSRLRRLMDADVPLRMRAASNPGGRGHGWVRKRFIDRHTEGRLFIPARLSDNPSLDADEYVTSLDQLPDLTRRQLLDGDWDATDGLAFPEFSKALHLVDPIRLDPYWRRASSLDFGVANPTACIGAAIDYDGNVIVHDLYYSPGLVSKHALEIGQRSAVWFAGKADWPHEKVCWADPSMWNRTGARASWGEAASAATEFQEHGVDWMVRGNNDPVAGRVRVSELLLPDASRLFPAWHPRYGEVGSPRLFVVGAACGELVEQLVSAPLLPLDASRSNAGEIVDPRWESRHGHAVAALRYLALSWPDASSVVVEPHVDPRVQAVRDMTARAFQGLLERARERTAIF